MLSEKSEDGIKRSTTTNTRNHLHRVPPLPRRFPRPILLVLFPLLKFSLLLRRPPGPSTCNVTAGLSLQRRSGCDEVSLRNTRYSALRAVVQIVILFLRLHLRMDAVPAFNGNISEKNATGLRALQPQCLVRQLLLDPNQNRWSSQQRLDDFPGGPRRVFLMSEYPGPFDDSGSEEGAGQFLLPTLLFFPHFWRFGDPVRGCDYGVL